MTTPVGTGHRSINVALRQTLDLYACWRPIRYFAGVSSPVKHPERVRIDLFRENTEDIYAGIEASADSTAAQSLKKVAARNRSAAARTFSQHGRVWH